MKMRITTATVRADTHAAAPSLPHALPNEAVGNDTTPGASAAPTPYVLGETGLGGKEDSSPSLGRAIHTGASEEVAVGAKRPGSSEGVEEALLAYQEGTGEVDSFAKQEEGNASAEAEEETLGAGGFHTDCETGVAGTLGESDAEPTAPVESRISLSAASHFESGSEIETRSVQGLFFAGVSGSAISIGSICCRRWPCCRCTAVCGDCGCGCASRIWRFGFSSVGRTPATNRSRCRRR